MRDSPSSTAAIDAEVPAEEILNALDEQNRQMLSKDVKIKKAAKPPPGAGVDGQADDEDGRHRPAPIVNTTPPEFQRFLPRDRDGELFAHVGLWANPKRSSFYAHFAGAKPASRQPAAGPRAARSW